MSKIYTPIGASNHCKEEREINDFYATHPAAIDYLFKVENFQKEIWEPAAGMGHLSKRMIELGHNVFSTDLIDRGYSSCIPNIDFLSTDTFHTITGKEILSLTHLTPKDLILLKEL